MPALPTDAAFTAWKRQIEVALEIAEAIVEGAEKAREIQLAAAVDAHAALEATRQSLETATSLPQLADAQLRLATANFGKAITYWGTLAGNARDVQVRIATILTGASPFPAEAFASFPSLPSFPFPGLKALAKAA